MKTLKKTLCLVLAMVMVFGLCVTSASAKLDAYTDKDDITYKEAVDVMTGIGILAGDTRGFRPTADITRAEAAKIIAYIMIGDAAQADALKATSDPFPDVPASHWASGYIAFCASKGIIAGKGDGYHPNENVKGLEFAKMLLCALGYGKQDEYIGSDWAIYTSRDALRYGIFNGNLAGASATKDATREECALYAFNTIAGANDNDDGTKTGIKKVSYSTLLGNYIENTMGAVNPDANKGTTFGDDFGLKYQVADDDVFGRIAGHHWTQKIGNNTRIISDDYDDDQRLLAVYTTAVTAGDIYKLIVDRFGKSFLEDVQDETATGTKNSGDFKLYLNNEDDDSCSSCGDGTTTVDVDPDNFIKGDTKTLAHTGNGVQTYVYAWTEVDDADLNYTTDYLRICIIDTYLAKVEKVVEAKGGRDPQTTVKLVKSHENTIPDTVAYSVTTEDFDEGDYVLVTITQNLEKTDHNKNLDTTKAGTVVDIELAPTLETEVTKFTKLGTTRSIVADGDTHYIAKNTAGNDYDADGTPANVTDQDVDTAYCVSNKIVDGEDHVIYLDNYGYLIATSKVSEVSNYAYVAKFGMKTNDATTLNDESVLRAAVYFSDGTDGIYTVDTKHGIFNKDVNMTASFAEAGDLKVDYVLYGAGAASATAPDEVTDEANIARIGVYRVSVNKDKITLEEKYVDTYTNAGEYVTRGQANILATDSTGDTTRKANSGTVFFYVKGTYGTDGFKVTVYNGINSVPVVKKANSTDTLVKNYVEKASGINYIIKAVYVKDDISGGETSDVVYFFGGTKDGNANFDKDRNEWTVRYYVYGNDGADYLTVKYDSKDDADDDIAAHKDPGFITVKNGKLDYVAQRDGTNNYSAKKGDITYVVDGTIEALTGDKADTFGTVSFLTDGTPGTSLSNVLVPLYKVAENGHIFDLRPESDQDDTHGPVVTLSELLSAFNNSQVNSLTVAMSVEFADDLNTVTAIYILQSA